METRCAGGHVGLQRRAWSFMETLCKRTSRFMETLYSVQEETKRFVESLRRRTCDMLIYGNPVQEDQ
jgi:hypothetical protein